jgi:beta-galactosidase
MPTHLTRRKFLALTAAATAHAAASHAAPTASHSGDPNTQSLAGPWRFALDREDTGIKSSWFAQTLPTNNQQPTTGSSTITLPGILQTQGYGDDIVADTPFVAALPRDMAWYKLPQYAAYTKPGHVEVPYLSQPTKHYLGVAWYQRDITIPAAWSGKRIALTLERTRWQTDLYLDDKLIGTNHSLVAPHDFDLGILAPGTHRLSIRIDNRMILPYRPDGHGVSDGEGATWNGIVGDIALTATTPIWIDDAQVFPSVANKSAHIKVRIGNLTGQPGSGTLTAGGISTPVTWTAEGADAVIDVPLPKATPWSEFTPTLQHLTLKLSGPQADDARDLTFGLREIKADGKTILLNGELFHFRATHDGGGFPLTGYPATDLATWRRIISICKDWGLNGMRFHSWCPPEAAFTAADQLGFYLQPECGMWNSFDADGKMLAILNDETARMIKAYGNHPSFVLLNATNEPAGHYAEQLPIWDKKWHDADPRRLYSDGTGRFSPPPAGPGTPFAADYLVTPGARGPRGWFGADYENTLKTMLRGSTVPCIGHEVGQWCSYPDFSVIDKFNGTRKYDAFPQGIGSGQTPYMVPGNYQIMRDSADAHGLLAKNKDLAYASGRFQVACYKEEIEASLRTPSYSGYELLDLHDYLGQGGALIGVLDAFWESKSYVTPAEFRRYNNTTVPLARLKDRVFTTASTLTADVEVAHFGPAPLPHITPRWSIVNYAGNTVASGNLPARDIPRGKNIPLGHISAALAKLPAPAEYALVVELRGTPFKNLWPFWLYPTNLSSRSVAEGSASSTAKVSSVPILVTSDWTEAETRLISGGKVLFQPKPADLDATDPKLSTVPIFWNHLMNPNGTTFLGLWNNAAHPALAGFPTESNCDWQWVDLFTNARAINLSTLPSALQPIVQPIDDWNRNLKLALLYECTVGYGTLMVCALDLNQNRPGAPSLRRSILDYMAGPSFHPRVAVAVGDLRNQWASQNPHTPPTPEQPTQPSSPDLVDPGQIRRPPN